MIVPVVVNSQSFSGRTNDVVFNFKQPDTVTTALPMINWVVPRIEYTNSTSNSVDIKAEIQSDVRIMHVDVKIGDGTTSRGSKALEIPQGRLHFSVDQSIRLLEGRNEISIVVENAKGGKISSSRFVTVGRDALADAIDLQRSDYALLFVTDKYDDWDDLSNPVNDGKTIESILREKYGFKTELVENATQEEVLAKIYEYNGRTFRPQDQLFIFFAGHGFFDDNLGEGFVVAKNSLRNDVGKTTYIPHAILRQRIDNIKCEHIFLTMDVCFGGTLDPVLQKSRAVEPANGPGDIDFLIRKLSKHTRKFLTSGSKEYVPDGRPGSHSPFASKFIQALKEVGGSENRMLTIPDFHRYFQRLSTEPRFGKFSDADDPASDFVFVARQ